MTLPLVPLPRSTVKVGDVEVPIRSLSRAEAVGMNDLGGDVDAIDTYVIAHGTSVNGTAPDLDAAAEWRKTTDTATVGLITDAVLVLSGLANGADPLAPGAGSSGP